MFHSLKFLLPLGLALATLGSATAQPDVSLVARQATSCTPGVHMMIAGGCALPCTTDVPSLLSTLIANITEAFPGSDQYYVPYDDSPVQAQESTPIMIAAANAYFQSCPNTPVVFIGYSLGGIIVMNTLCGGLSEANAPNVLAAITYGEETFRYPLSYDLGTCTNNAPLYPRNNTEQCVPFAPAIQDYCDAADPQCCTGGTVTAAHFAYPNAYDIPATNFIKSRYAALLPSSSSSSSTVPSSTASSATSSTKIYTNTTVTTTGMSSASASVSGITTTPATGTASSISAVSIKLSTPSPTAPYSAPVTTFPSIPNSAILQPSSVVASYLPSSEPISGVPSSGASASAASASAASASAASASAAPATGVSASGASTAAASAGSAGTAATSAAGPAASAASGSTASGTAAASPAVYTGSSSRLSIPGLVFIQWLCKAWRCITCLVTV